MPSAFLEETFPQGTRIVRAADANASPLPLASAEYETTAPVHVPAGVGSAVLPIRATRAGAFANVVVERLVDTTQLTLAAPALLSDPYWVADSCSAAGGSDGPDAEVLKTFARAYASGQYAPTDMAILAGALDVTGVRHAAILQNNTIGRTQLYVADASWGTSTELQLRTLQHILDEFAGWGCRVSAYPVTNIFVRLTCTVQLRDARYLQDTTDIEVAIRKALRAYFDNRPDWYLWRNDAIRGAVANADRRIGTCTLVTVKDRAGATLAEPSVTAETSSELTHFYLTSDAVTATFAAPV